MMPTYQLDLKGRVVRESRVRVLNGGLMRVYEPCRVPAERVNVEIFKQLRGRVRRK